MASCGSALDTLVTDHPVKVLPLVLDTCQMLEPSPRALALLKSCPNLRAAIVGSIERGRGGGLWAEGEERVEAPLVWAAVSCLPYLGGGKGEATLAKGLASALLVRLGEEEAEEGSRKMLDFLVGSTLRVYTSMAGRLGEAAVVGEVGFYTEAARQRVRSAHVVGAVGEYLETVHR